MGCIPRVSIFCYCMYPGLCQKKTVRGCFGLGTARVKALGELKKERKKGKKEGRNKEKINK